MWTRNWFYRHSRSDWCITRIAELSTDTCTPLTRSTITPPVIFHISHIHPSHSLYSPLILYPILSSKSTKENYCRNKPPIKTLFSHFPHFGHPTAPPLHRRTLIGGTRRHKPKIAFQLGGFGKSLSVLFCGWFCVLHCTNFCTQQPHTKSKSSMCGCVDVVG